MFGLWCVLAGILLYMEAVYHLGCFGFSPVNPVLLLPLAGAAAGAQTFVAGCVPGKWKKCLLWVFLGGETFLVAAQMVYWRIFRQPLLWEAAVLGGQAAVTHYWREALAGIWKTSGFLFLLLLPLPVFGAGYHKFASRTRTPHTSDWPPGGSPDYGRAGSVRGTGRGPRSLRRHSARRSPAFFSVSPPLSPDLRISARQPGSQARRPRRIHRGLPAFRGLEKLRILLLTVVSAVLAAAALFLGKYTQAAYYEDYTEFFDPGSVARSLGVLTLAQRDTVLEIKGIFRDLGKAEASQGENLGNESPAADSQMAEKAPGEPEPTGRPGWSGMPNGSGPKNARGKGAARGAVETSPHVLSIDWESLNAQGESKEESWLVKYLQEAEPTERNEYTGIFRGYNLVYLTAEGFSPYAVREDLTPTLYRLIHSGFVFTDYYVPLWQTSTSDGEYVNCTGLIPDGQFSMRKSVSNELPFTLPRFFAQEGVSSLAFHNNTLTYYDRYLTHRNLGYDFWASSLGELPQEEWGDRIFPMEHPEAWPASDWEMMQGTLPQYIGLNRFNVYYMTISGHMNYNFKGNAMSDKNREAVEALPLSENARAYIACHIELDKALACLLEELEAAGKLENTVICLSADHYPYAMTQKEYEELAGKPLGNNLDLYRSNLVLWNAGMEEYPVVVEKACESVDILPTLLNLFGFAYDSRLYAGQDVFSGEEGLVIFNDRSFVTDTVFYNRKAKTTVWRAELEAAGRTGAEAGSRSVTDSASPLFGWAYPGAAVVAGKPQDARFAEGASLEEEREAYLSEKKQEVKNRYQFSAYVLQKNYYAKIRKAIRDP
jgi:hypothetical protein